MSEPLLQVRDLHKRFGGVTATDGLELTVMRGEIHALIGPNGAGKTTLIAQLCGMLRPDAGSIHFDGRDITALSAPARSHLGLARSFQITSIFPEFTVLENVALAVQAHAGHSFRFWRPAAHERDLNQRAMTVLDDVGLGARAGAVAGTLAHGEQRQLEIAMAMATEPKLLLLDEPMAGMGGADAERMTAFLAGLRERFTLLLVEHDMDAVFALADRITVLVYGRAIASGTADDVRRNRGVRQAYLGDDHPSEAAASGEASPNRPTLPEEPDARGGER